MTLAAILGMYLWGLGGVHAQTLSFYPGFLAQATQSPQTSTPAQTTPSTQTSTTPPGSSSTTAKKHHIWHHKKVLPPGCSDITPTPANAANTPGTTSAADTAVTTSGSGTSAAESTAATKPCPPPKKIVRNGGAREPAIQLSPDSSAQQAAQKRSTEQLTANTEDNLKKVEGRDLSSSQQEMVNQVKQFLKQSKAATSSGDADLAHSLAQKAQLLSEELVKP